MEGFLDREAIQKKVKRKTLLDRVSGGVILVVAALCASSIIFTVIFILIKGIEPFVSTYKIDGQEYTVDFWQFLTGTSWHSGAATYGAGYIIVNTLYISFLTILLTAPIGILTALVITKMSGRFIGKIINSVVELLAAIPSVIYGMFGLGYVTRITKWLSDAVGYQSAGGLGTLTAVIVLTMMSFPTVTMLAASSIKGVNPAMELGSLALGASKTQTNFKVVLTSARGGIFARLILGIDRALGEATAVSLVAGNAASGPNWNLFGITRTLTTSMLTGMNEATGLNYDIRFSVGILLIVLIVIVNALLEIVKRRLERK